ncbi:MAG: secretin N-terminal domain-containing protein [Planctomycetota bacterium]
MVYSATKIDGSSPTRLTLPRDMPLRSFLLSRLAAFTAAVTLALPVSAAESEMVGLLAVAIEPAVAEQLQLSDEQRQQLIELVDQREMKGFSRAMKLAKKPREERVVAFADFRAESERLAMAMLTPEQADQLRTIAAGRDDAALEPVELTADDADDAKQDEGTEAMPKASPAARPLSGQDTTPPPTSADSSDGKLSFNFQQQPWDEVFQWFAERAGLSVIVDNAPPGSLSYRDDRRYSPAEALDVLNGVLLTKGYTLVRKDRMLLVIDLEQDVIPPNVVTDVPLAELDMRGQYELVRVLLELDEVDPTAAADSLQRLVGPQGAIVVLPEAQMLQVTETAGRIRTMIAVIDAMRRSAQPVESEGVTLKSYPTGGAEGEALLAVLQTLLEGSDSARLAVDKQTGSLIALASAEEHDAIRQALDKLQTGGRRVELIRVGQVDPLSAAAMVSKLFDPDAGDDKKRDPNAPVIEADRYSDALLVRGTAAQIEQIRELVGQLDEPDAALEPGARGTIRTLPLSQAELEQALQRIEPLWPALRGNPLRMTAPTQGIPSFRPGADVEREQLRGDDPLNLLDSPSDPAEEMPRGRTTTLRAPSRFRFANQPQQPVGGLSEADYALASDPSSPTGRPPEATDSRNDPVFISPSNGSTVIASRDVEALDVLERLLATVIDANATSGRQYAVFYLKFADATTAGALLNGIFGGGDSGGGSLMGDLAGAAIGGAGGDLLGGLLGGGGGSDSVGFDSVSVDIVPDVRLNALYVHARPDDLQTVNQLLRVIDQPRGPDRIESTGRPRLIPILHAEVNEIATVVRQVFADRLGSGTGGGQPSPEEFLRALSGQDNGVKEQEPERMTLGIDERSRSLVVRSSEPLFEEVRSLVEQIDREQVADPTATRVVSLRNTSSNALLQTLTSMLGEKAVIVSTTGEAAAAAAKPKAPEPAAPNENNDDAARRAEQQRREFRERIEGFRRMQRAMERMQRQRGSDNERGGGGRRRGGPPQR